MKPERKAQMKAYYEANREKWKAYKKKYKQSKKGKKTANGYIQRVLTPKRRALKKKLVEQLGGKCERCGYNEHPAALDFHHINPKTKKHSIGILLNTLNEEAIQEELVKCALLCANCHRIATHDKKTFNKSFKFMD